MFHKSFKKRSFKKRSFKKHGFKKKRHGYRISSYGSSRGGVRL
ncbi:MAG: hypothetical protein [Arizlama microvirus]|nr:MAG: hypothetical protein [Arizlama microvirus]